VRGYPPSNSAVSREKLTIFDKTYKRNRIYNCVVEDEDGPLRPVSPDMSWLPVRPGVPGVKGLPSLFVTTSCGKGPEKRYEFCWCVLDLSSE
jgi:hypothetical protein